MQQQEAGFHEVAYPRIRQWTAAAYRSVRHKPVIHGLLEVDVTAARTRLRAHKAQTGEQISFTAFLIVCLSRAVAEHPAVQAVRKGRRRLVIFDDVDLWTPVEREFGQGTTPLPHLVRAANRKSLRAIHEEIRAAQVANVDAVLRGPRLLPEILFGPALWLLWRIGRRRPQMLRRTVGTVGLTAVGMFGKGAGWGVPPPFPVPLLVSVGGIGVGHEHVDGRIVPHERLSLTISVDHNIVDGAPAARFAARLKELIESGYGLDELERAKEPERADEQRDERAPMSARAHP